MLSTHTWYRYNTLQHPYRARNFDSIHHSTGVGYNRYYDRNNALYTKFYDTNKPVLQNNDQLLSNNGKLSTNYQTISSSSINKSQPSVNARRVKFQEPLNTPDTKYSSNDGGIYPRTDGSTNFQLNTSNKQKFYDRKSKENMNSRDQE